jgi:hypothetical protein
MLSLQLPGVRQLKTSQSIALGFGYCLGQVAKRLQKLTARGTKLTKMEEM